MNIDRKIDFALEIIKKFLLLKYVVITELGSFNNVLLVVRSPNKKIHSQIRLITSGKKIQKSKLFGKVYEWTLRGIDEDRKDYDLFYCFICFDKDMEKYRRFIVPKNIVGKYLREEHKYWITYGKTHKENDWRAFRLGFKEITYSKLITPPMADDYEEKWDLI